MNKLFLIIFAVMCVFLPQVNAEEQGITRKNLEITVYNKNLGLVKDTREITLTKGVNEFIWPEVSAQIDSTSVNYNSAASWVLEQNYQYDLVSRAVLLSKYIGKEITIVPKDKDGKPLDRYKGNLLSVEGERISSIDVDGKVILDPQGEVILPALPKGLLLRPTLLFKIDSDKAGKQTAEISYLTGGITWKADYILVLNPNDTKFSLNGWVTVDNQSGANYPDAKLKLIAGDIHLVEANIRQDHYYAEESLRAVSKRAPEPQFQESSLFEYHMYTMQRPTTIGQKETKQISFINANDANCKKLFIYDYNDYYRWWWHYNDDRTKGQKIMVKVEIENKKQDNLGMPLPKGKVRIYKKDNEDKLQFVGEDLIDHTPVDEKIRLYVGDAFDIVGQRTVKKSNQSEHTLDETIEITVRNHKEEDIEVNIVEHMNLPNWEITAKDHDFVKKDAWTAEFPVKIKKRGEDTITYSYHAWW